MSEGQELKDKYTERDIRKQMISLENFSTAETRIPRYLNSHCKPSSFFCSLSSSSSTDSGYGSVLPRHNPDHDKQYVTVTIHATCLKLHRGNNNTFHH